MRITETALLVPFAAAMLLSCSSSRNATYSVERTRILIDSSYDASPDRAATAFMAPYKAHVDSLMNPIVGYAASNMSSYQPESPLTNLLSDILVWGGQAFNEHPDFAVYNVGGIRASLSKGAVTIGDVLDMAPFENKICFLTLFRKQGARTIPPDNGARRTGCQPFRPPCHGQARQPSLGNHQRRACRQGKGLPYSHPRLCGTGQRQDGRVQSQNQCRVASVGGEQHPVHHYELFPLLHEAGKDCR